MSKYQSYTEYKDSGVEWLGEIPNEWSILKLKYAVELISEKSQDSSQKYVGMENITSKNGQYFQTEEVIPEGVSNTFKVGDVLFGKLRPYLAKSWLSDFSGICSSELLVLRAKKISPRFLQYYTLTDEFINQVDSSTYGSKMPRASWEFIELLPIPTSSFELTNKIANFLDHETAKIDSLIAKQEKLIELLKEKRQAVISHAVTKGLNPNVVMKDSGVEWLGQVPEHWILSNLKYFASIQGGYAFNSDLFVEEGIQVLRIGNVYQNTLSLDRQPIYISNELVKNFKDFIVSKNDVLMSLTGTLGKRDYGFAIKVKTDEKYLLNQRVAKISPNPSKIDTDFMVYVLWSESYLTQLYSLPSGTKQANLSNSDVLGIQIVVPPSLEEQKDIAKYLKNKLLKFDDMILKAESAISLMQERRTALISAAVTGKIDVRNWQHPNEEKKGLIS